MEEIWLRISPLLIHWICPFRLLFITSNPCKVRHTLSHEKKPIPGLTSRLMRAVVLFDQVVEVLALLQFTAHHQRGGS